MSKTLAMELLSFADNCVYIDGAAVVTAACPTDIAAGNTVSFTVTLSLQDSELHNQSNFN